MSMRSESNSWEKHRVEWSQGSNIDMKNRIKKCKDDMEKATEN